MPYWPAVQAGLLAGFGTPGAPLEPARDQSRRDLARTEMVSQPFLARGPAHAVRNAEHGRERDRVTRRPKRDGKCLQVFELARGVLAQALGKGVIGGDGEGRAHDRRGGSQADECLRHRGVGGEGRAIGAGNAARPSTTAVDSEVDLLATATWPTRPPRSG